MISKIFWGKFTYKPKATQGDYVTYKLRRNLLHIIPIWIADVQIYNDTCAGDVDINTFVRRLNLIK